MGFEATCIDYGLTDGRYCTTCKTMFVPQEVLFAKGHNFVDYVCTECGSDFYTNGLEFTYSSYGGDIVYTVSDYYGSEQAVVIPSNYLFNSHLLSVAVIDNGAFSNCTSITSIIIPTSVKSISSRAFYNCSSLKTVYYTGTQQQWKYISISSSGNEALTNATIIYNYKG